MTTAKLYFEAHVTIDPVFGQEREVAEGLAKPHNFKLAKLYMDKGVPNQKDTFMTGHGRDLHELTERMRNLISTLRISGFTVRRYKIEDTLMDSRTEDVLGVLS